ncbi:GIY-YIG nuclease family protein [Pelotalea chapellei]|uniref:GIY-YIG nuclease family protein n=1 Tax=Pelotalea chapellei TaxID=44671 RepID=A0ABS5UCS2_9BACT|nr:GIY-YIG nuclease family protein [Pelotalea chapellei]MBT1073487.1 GIY-YIG nuclease family protein [Pelotalea chapellei]
MAAEDKVTVKGQSGTQYEFEVYPWGTTFNPVGGLYIVLKKQPGNYGILYIGQTGNLSERFDNHHQSDSFTRYGKTHIAVRAESSEQKRFTFETDLIRNYNTCCNKQ